MSRFISASRKYLVDNLCRVGYQHLANDNSRLAQAMFIAAKQVSEPIYIDANIRFGVFHLRPMFTNSSGLFIGQRPAEFAAEVYLKYGCFSKAFEEYSKVKDKSLIAQHNYAILLFDKSRSGGIDITNSLAIFEELSDAGNAYASYNLSAIHYHGEVAAVGVPVDNKKSLYYAVRAFEEFNVICKRLIILNSYKVLFDMAVEDDEVFDMLSKACDNDEKAKELTYMVLSECRIKNLDEIYLENLD